MVEGFPIIDESNYLDVWNIFAYELIGSAALAFFIGLLIIAIVGNKKKFPMPVIFIMALAWVGCVYVGSGLGWLWAYAIFIVGFIVYYKVGKFIG